MSSTTTTESLMPIILFDIPGNAPSCRAWSPNTWRVRYSLNFKGLPLKTEWVEYPDIAALYHRLDLAATAEAPDGSPHYTLPVIHDPNTNRTISESEAIVKYLDKAYPSTPALFPKGTLAFHSAFRDMARMLMGPLYQLVCYAVWTRLNERSQAYFRRTREATLGKKLEEVKTDEDWEKAEKAFTMIDAWFRANSGEGEGKDELIMGDQVCFADIMLISNLMWAKTTLGEESGDWARIMSWNEGRWARIMQRFARYEVVDL